MLDIGWSELMVIGVVALIVVGPKDLPIMFRTLGRFTAKARSMGREFQRAMDRAADDSGMKDVAKDLKAVTSPSSLGIDALQNAASRFEKWDPLKPAAKPISSTPVSPAAGMKPAVVAPVVEAAVVKAAVPGPATAALIEKRAASKAALANRANGAATAAATTATVTAAPTPVRRKAPAKVAAAEILGAAPVMAPVRIPVPRKDPAKAAASLAVVQDAVEVPKPKAPRRPKKSDA